MEAQKLLHIAADFVQAGREQQDALLLDIEIEDRRPAVEAEWAAALNEFIDGKINALVR